MSANKQTVIHGGKQTPDFLKSFTKFEVVTGFNPKDFEQLAFLIPGIQGCGKTSLVSTAPDVLRFDFDGARDNNPNSVGSAISFNRGPEDYRRLIEILETLEDLSARKQPRPAFICIDTVDSFLESVKQFVIHNAREKYPARKDNILTIDDIPGGYGWQKVYEHAEPIISRILLAGYGLILFCYFFEENYTSTDPVTKQETVTTRLNHTIPPKFWQKIKGKVDYVCGLGNRTETEIVWGEPRKDGNGNPLKDGSGNLIRQVKERRQKTTHYVNFMVNQKGPETLKQRIPVPDEVVLPSHPDNPRIPAEGNFDLIRQAYNAAKAEIAPKS